MSDGREENVKSIEESGHGEQVSGEERNDMSGDAIGDTVFSKHWLFQCLLNTLQEITGEPESSDAPLELDNGVEDELCVLWDMSVNEDVANFLNDFKVIQLFEAIIVKTNSPRLAEICAGILANIAVNNHICVAIANKEGLRELMLGLLSSSDTPFLMQLIRLISTSLSNTDAQPLWMSSISSTSEQMFATLQYALENCLNCDVIKSLFVFIYKVLYIDDSLCLKWLSIGDANGSVECLTHSCLRVIEDEDNIEYADYYWLILHLLSLSNENFISSHMRPIESDISVIFEKFVTLSFGESVDFMVPSMRRVSALTASLAVCSQLMVLEDNFKAKLINNCELIDCFRNLLYNYKQSLNEMNTNSETFELVIQQLENVIQFVIK